MMAETVPLNLVCANIVLHLLYHPGAVTGQHDANAFRGVQLGVTPLHGCAVARLMDEITLPLPPLSSERQTVT